MSFFSLVLFFSVTVQLSTVIQAAAQTAEVYPAPGVAAKTIQSATVIVDGRKLFRVVGTSTFPARKRADLIARRIRKLAQDPSFDPGTLEIKTVNGLAIIFAGNNRLLSVHNEDAQLEGDFSAEELARELIIEQIAGAI
jgi:hypothetical protein